MLRDPSRRIPTAAPTAAVAPGATPPAGAPRPASAPARPDPDTSRWRYVDHFEMRPVRPRPADHSARYITAGRRQISDIAATIERLRTLDRALEAFEASTWPGGPPSLLPKSGFDALVDAHDEADPTPPDRPILSTDARCLRHQEVAARRLNRDVDYGPLEALRDEWAAGYGALEGKMAALRGELLKRSPVPEDAARAAVNGRAVRLSMDAKRGAASYGQPDAGRRALQTALAEVLRLTHPALLEGVRRIDRTQSWGAAGGYDPTSRTVRVKRSADLDLYPELPRQTWFHELGHAVESSLPWLLAASRAFRAHRTRSGPHPAEHFAPAEGPGGWYFDGPGPDLYYLRSYEAEWQARGAPAAPYPLPTEVFSSGLGFFADPRSMRYFALSDPDGFAWMLGILEALQCSTRDARPGGPAS